MGDTGNFHWNWYRDIVDQTVGSHPVLLPGRHPMVGTEGFLASTVPYEGAYYSDRDESTDAKLRAVLRYYDLPSVMRLPVVPAGGLPDSFECPEFPCSWPWFFPRDFGDDFSGAPFDTREPPIGPIPPRPPTFGPFDGLLADLTPTFGPTLVDALSNQKWAFAVSVESYAVLEANALENRFVMIPVGATTNPEFHLVHVSDSQLHAKLMNNFGANLPMGGKAVYSALENALFLVGGIDGGSPAGLLRFDLDSETKTTLEVVPAANVLAATYDVAGARLFFLDDSGPGPEKRVATLRAVDMSDGTAAELWSVPYDGGPNSIHLALTEERDLVMVSASATAYQAWSYRPGVSSLHLLGKLEGTGRVVDGPVLTVDGLVLPVLESAESLDLRILEPSHFLNKREPCLTL